MSASDVGTVARLRRELVAAQKRSDKLAMARAALPIGSSRARITTANARWSSAAEARDRAQKELDDALAGGSQ